MYSLLSYMKFELEGWSRLYIEFELEDRGGIFSPSLNPFFSLNPNLDCKSSFLKFQTFLRPQVLQTSLN